MLCRLNIKTARSTDQFTRLMNTTMSKNPTLKKGHISVIMPPVHAQLCNTFEFGILHRFIKWGLRDYSKWGRVQREGCLGNCGRWTKIILSEKTIISL